MLSSLSLSIKTKIKTELQKMFVKSKPTSMNSLSQSDNSLYIPIRLPLNYPYCEHANYLKMIIKTMFKCRKLVGNRLLIQVCHQCQQSLLDLFRIVKCATGQKCKKLHVVRLKFSRRRRPNIIDDRCNCLYR